MDEALARIVIADAMQASRAIGGLPYLLKEHGDEDIRMKLRDPIGVIIIQIYQGILEPVFERFPHLRNEFDQSMERFGRGC